MDKKPLIMKWLAVGIILLFVGVTIAPSINVVVAKEEARKKIVDVVGSSRVCMDDLITMVHVYKKDGPWLWLFIRILEILSNILKTMNYAINLIMEGKFLSELFRGVCILILIPLIVISQYRILIYSIFEDFVPWTWEDTLLYHILVFLFNIVLPNQMVYRNFHLIMNYRISTGVLMED